MTRSPTTLARMWDHLRAVRSEAATVLRVRALPPALQPRLSHAFRLEGQWRLDEALHAWTALRDARPRYAYAHEAMARVLANLDRPREAIAVLEAARAALPGSAALVAAHAQQLHRAGAFAEALEVARIMLARHPRLALSHEMVARTLRHLRRFEEAAATVAQARARFPADRGLAIEDVVIAEVSGDWPAMLDRAEATVRAFPRMPLAHACYGGALKKLGRFAEADAAFAAAMARFPNDSNLAINHAWVADDQGDWQEASRRWSLLMTRFGRNPRVRQGYQETLGRAALHRLDAASDAEPVAASGPAPASPPAVDETVEAALATLFAGFQGIGSDCEVGFVQRRFGAEPLGLLRWAGIAYDKLLIGLDADFEGVGGAERTRLNLNPANQEYFTTDTFYGMSMHTFVVRNETDEAALYAKMARRLGFLRDRLLDDLRSGEKIFLFKAGDEGLGEDQAHALHAAIRRHGPGRLLVVREARAGERPGAVRRLGEGLALGLLDRNGFRDGHWTISFALWVEICRAAADLLG